MELANGMEVLTMHRYPRGLELPMIAKQCGYGDVLIVYIYIFLRLSCEAYAGLFDPE
jgi:hypothetical protein